MSLYRCDKCEIFFKSKKGFEGHVQNRHSPRVMGSDGKPRTKKEIDGINKVRRESNLRRTIKLQLTRNGSNSVFSWET